jgi:hypothetical protein
MNYDLPLMEEEIKSYIVSDEVDSMDVLDCRPGFPIFKVTQRPIIHTTRLRQWWEPIEDEL